MNQEHLIQNLIEFSKSARLVNIIVGSRKGANDLVVQRLQITVNLAEEFRQIIKDFLDNIVASDIKEYDPQYKKELHELLRLNIEAGDRIDSTIRKIVEIDNAEIFSSSNKPFITQLKFYAVILGDVGDNSAIFFRVFTPKKVLGRDKRLAIILTNNIYDSIKDEILLFDKEFDCFVWEGQIQIVYVSNFNKIFQYYQELKNQADVAITFISERIPILNHDDFKEVCAKDIRMTAKLASISSRPDLSTLTFDSVKKTIEDYNVPVEISSENGRESLVFDRSPKTRWLILRLLDDDYLSSAMTSRRYEVNSKTAL